MPRTLTNSGLLPVKSTGDGGSIDLETLTSDINTSGKISAFALQATANVRATTIAATGNVTATNVLATGNVQAVNFTATGNVNAANLAATTVTATGNAAVGGVLSFGSRVQNNLLTLWGPTDPSSVTKFGFGINDGVMRYDTNTTTNSHVFYGGGVGFATINSAGLGTPGDVQAANLVATNGLSSANGLRVTKTDFSVDNALVEKQYPTSLTAGSNRYGVGLAGDTSTARLYAATNFAVTEATSRVALGFATGATSYNDLVTCYRAGGIKLGNAALGPEPGANTVAISNDTVVTWNTGTGRTNMLCLYGDPALASNPDSPFVYGFGIGPQAVRYNTGGRHAFYNGITEIASIGLQGISTPANVAANCVVANGAFLTSLNASSITTGTLSNSRLPTDMTTEMLVAGSIAGDGSLLTFSSLGVGTQEPSANLHVVGNAIVTDGLRLATGGNLNFGGRTSTNLLCFSPDNGDVAAADTYGIGTMSDALRFQTPSAGVFRFFIGNTERASIVANANKVLNFTGQHRTLPAAPLADATPALVGRIVCSTGSFLGTIGINESMPLVELSQGRNDKRAFGVISDAEDPGSASREVAWGSFVTVTAKDGPEDHRLIINSLGEGAVWVCNINGNIENGDYITTCEVPGLGMRQDDDVMRNYTVAKALCGCSFELGGGFACEEFEFGGQTLRRAFIGVSYHCG